MGLQGSNGDKIDYYDGFYRLGNGTSYAVNHAYLAGLQCSWNNADFSSVFTLQANYKNIQHKHDATFHIMGIWIMHFFKRKLTFSGCADCSSR